jgi:hypothetical protein
LLVTKHGKTWLRAGIAINVALLVGLLWYVGSLSYPASEATRLRNALVLDLARPRDLSWTPMTIPPTYQAERGPASRRFAGIIDELGVQEIDGDWKKALVLAGHLSLNAKGLGAIQSDLETAYTQIVRHGRGYCADFTQVYLGLAHAAGLFAREWAFSFDGFGGHGHTFIEVYDRQREQWIWLDVHNNVHAVDAQSGDPLSAEQFRAYALGARGNVLVRRNGPGRLGYKHTEKLVDYYRRGASEWYLWWGNAVFAYEENWAVRAGARVARAAEQLMAIAIGVHPRIKVLPTQYNAAALERMIALKAKLWGVAAAGILMVVLLLCQLLYLWRRRVDSESVTRASASGLAIR